MPRLGRLLSVALVAAGPLWATPASAQVNLTPFEDIAGIPEVESGDILQLDDRRVRLYGVDAPEMGQTCQNRRGVEYDCGMAARNLLDRLIAGREVECTLFSEALGNLWPGRCTLNGGDIAATMVIMGYAFVYRGASTRYVDAQSLAQTMERGLWSGRQWIYPWEYRALERDPLGLDDTPLPGEPDPRNPLLQGDN